MSALFSCYPSLLGRSRHLVSHALFLRHATLRGDPRNVSVALLDDPVSNGPRKVRGDPNKGCELHHRDAVHSDIVTVTVRKVIRLFYNIC